MTTTQTPPPADLERLTENLSRLEDLSKRLQVALLHKRAPNPALEGPGPELIAETSRAAMTDLVENPARIVERQVDYWGKTLTHYMEAMQALAAGNLEPPEDPGPKDRRFANPLWDTNPYFNFVKQQYQRNAAAIAESVKELDTLDPATKTRAEYFARQLIDMMAPTNFLATNPDALERAVETQGESLVRGLENLVRDIEANKGEMMVSLADREAFTVGENIATTPGAVVFRNELIELIQYAPSTKTVHATPLIIFPPWINKFYILDLKPANSLLKWIVDQGFTLFVVSWKNPDHSYADTSMEDYVEKGYLAAIDAAKRITGQKKVNAVGYCIAGTTLSLTLSLMEKRKDKSVNCATFFTTLTDFTEPGEVGVFLNEDFLSGIEAQCARDGILSKFFMSRTFSFLRSNDLIYQPAIRSYLMGERPPAFDLLFWNGDGTNLPGRMAVEYLRGLCQRNEFARDGFELFGEKLRIGDVKVPLCAIACETDHIAAWRSSYDGIRQFGSTDKTFILSESGHIAGIVNPPSKGKYGHYTNDADITGLTREAWKEGAEFHKGSWWPRWGEWLAKRSGKQVAARVPGSEPGFPMLAPAPGTYVVEVPAD